ncbi:RNA helicase [Mucor velutinosus]|uniref:RNA helicase n=1 Tax=Mucor velutinosus TaxID=708070 RepID=A0AAN7I2R3_9FUNG|nr:RNA helicase [Mucor velutinosus]
MYSQHHYNHDNLSRENAHAHPLGRPASMPSLYPPSSSNGNYKVVNEDLIQQRSSLDGHGPYSNHAAGAATGASHSWATPNSNNSSGWNHNPHHDNNIGGSTHHGSNSTTVTSPPPPLSTMMHTNHADNNTASSSSSTATTTAATTSPTHHIKSNMDLPSIDKHYSNSPSANLMSAYNSSPNYFVSPTTANTVYNSPHLSHHHHHPPSASSLSSASHHQQQYQQQQSNTYSAYGMTSSMPSQARHSLAARPKLTTTLWEDEGTICYQVDANGICVARRQDNDMINGTKLLNVAGMSRGKRDGILKNEKGRVVVKVGAMHLKGVWITFVRAKLLAAQYKIQEILYPLFVEDPSVFLYATALHNSINTSRMNGLNGYRTQQYGNFNSSSSPSSAATGATPNASSINPTSSTNWDRHNNESNTSSYRNAGFHGSMMNHPSDAMFILSSQVEYNSNSNHNGHSNRQSIGGLVGGYNNNAGSNGPYSVYQQHQDKPSQTGSNNRMYFSDELLDDGGGKQNHDCSLYGHKSMLPGTLSSPTSSEAGNKASAFHLPPSRGSGEYDSNATTTATSSSTTSTPTSAERRQSVIMATPRVASPRHHPYMSPGKVYTPSIMSSLQSYRQSSLDEDRKDGDLDSQQQHSMAAVAVAADINRHPW